MAIRRAKQQPWYHVPLPRCMVTTQAEERCLFTAKWTDKKTHQVELCTMHSRLADFDVVRIPEHKVDLV